MDEIDLAGALMNEEETKVVSKEDSRSSFYDPEDAYMPIKALNQFSNDWIIKARVVKKGDLRTWKNVRGEGQLFNIELIDRQSTLIQATAFNETAEKFHAMLEEG